MAKTEIHTPKDYIVGEVRLAPQAPNQGHIVTIGHLYDKPGQAVDVNSVQTGKWDRTRFMLRTAEGAEFFGRPGIPSAPIHRQNGIILNATETLEKEYAVFWPAPLALGVLTVGGTFYDQMIEEIMVAGPDDLVVVRERIDTAPSLPTHDAFEHLDRRIASAGLAASAWALATECYGAGK